MEQVLHGINRFLWGIPVLLMIILVGILFTLHSRFAQIRLLPKALKRFFWSLKRGDMNNRGISGYRALCTALAATVGTGNIAGVAGAMAIGGPGVVFWMWLCALLGMVIKLAEVTLSVHYRTTDSEGKPIGGPMYMIRNGLPGKLQSLAYIYCFLGVVAAFGVGNATQINAVIEGVRSICASRQYELGMLEVLLLGCFIAVMISLAFHKGANGIGILAERLVPFASIAYILLSLGVLINYCHRIPSAILAIIRGAFYPRAVTGGIVGSMIISLRVGSSRGVFTNEAGMGTAAIAHASAATDHPVDQGLLGIIEVFLDTIVLCTLTALVILCSGVLIPYGEDPGITLTLDAFAEFYGNWSKTAITLLVCIFAFATILGWGLYGARCLQFLFGERAWKLFVLFQAICIIVSVTLKTSVVWIFAEIVNGLMAIPNLIALLYLLPTFLGLLDQYTNKRKAYRLK